MRGSGERTLELRNACAGIKPALRAVGTMGCLLCPQDPSKDAGVRPNRPALFLEFDLSVLTRLRLARCLFVPWVERQRCTYESLVFAHDG